MNFNFQIFPNELLPKYLDLVGDGLGEAFNKLEEAEISTDTFSFYTSVASVYSSKIEGEPIELDSYIKHKRFAVPYQPDYTKKIDDLYNAYSFAKSNPLNQENVFAAHRLLAKHLLNESQLGKYRTQHMYVTNSDGKIEYVAASPHLVQGEMDKFFADIDFLLAKSMQVPEAFFYAAMVHLVFVKIHPFTDGNGRTGRLLEKWFLAEKLGEKAWFLQSEKYYYSQHQTYYANLQALGLEYEGLDYGKALPFLRMLEKAL